MDLIKKKTFWYALVALLVFFTDIWVYFYLKSPSSSTSQAALQTNAQALRLKDPVNNESELSLSSDTLTTSETSPMISKDPEAELEKIKTRAIHLTKDEVANLSSEAVNQQSNQDKRFESVYLLSYNGRAIMNLKEIVESPIPETQNEGDRDFEHILRAQAIEGIENGQEKKLSQQIIQELIQKTDNVFLLDRLERAQKSLNGLSSSSEVQDNRQLQKIIEN